MQILIADCNHGVISTIKSISRQQLVLKKPLQIDFSGITEMAVIAKQQFSLQCLAQRDKYCSLEVKRSGGAREEIVHGLSNLQLEQQGACFTISVMTSDLQIENMWQRHACVERM